MNRRFDFDSQAISPPAHDESFFYIRYPTGVSNNDKKPSAASNNIKSISDAITKHQLDTIKPNSSKSLIEKKNMVQHTEPCKQYLNQKERGKPKFETVFCLFLFVCLFMFKGFRGFEMSVQSANFPVFIQRIAQVFAQHTDTHTIV